MDWMDLAQDWEQWRALVKDIIKLCHLCMSCQGSEKFKLKRYSESVVRYLDPVTVITSN
jgi:hypothetical protein